MKRTLTVFAILVVSILPLSAAVKQIQTDDPLKAASVKTYKTIGTGADLKLYVFNPLQHTVTDERPAIVFFFGGGWTGGTPSQFTMQAEHLASRGMVAVCAEYRTKKSHNTGS